VREDLIETFEDVEVRTSRSQVAFRRRRGFAVLWRPGRYLAHPGAEVVLSILLERRVASPRWKEVVQPAPGGGSTTSRYGHRRHRRGGARLAARGRAGAGPVPAR
jgi:hypothetical protein